MEQIRYYLSYIGIGLPLRLVNPIDEADTRNRNTYIRGCYGAGRLISCEKLVYGEVELSHRYQYHSNGTVCLAEIAIAGEDTTIIRFDEQGHTLSMESL